MKIVRRGTPKSWNYDTDGVAYCGMFAEFLNDVLTYPGDRTSAGQDVVNNLMSGAEYFYQSWKSAKPKRTMCSRTLLVKSRDRDT
jgi:hypothetical protein